MLAAGSASAAVNVEAASATHTGVHRIGLQDFTRPTLTCRLPQGKPAQLPNGPIPPCTRLALSGTIP